MTSTPKLKMSEELDYILSNRHLVKYSDLNATHNLFGGQMMAWMDEGAALYAASVMGSPLLVTRHIGPIEFRAPCPLGALVNVYCAISKEGTTSLGVTALVTTCSPGNTDPNQEVLVTTTEFVFVCVDESGNKRRWHRNN
jgi:acyl-CoA hydrolase